MSVDGGRNGQLFKESHGEGKVRVEEKRIVVSAEP